MQKISITAEFHSYWHIGTGRGSGQNLDALVEKDESGLPYVSGKTIKGLIRDAAYKLDSWQGTTMVDLLFGRRNDDSEQSKDETEAGLLRFSNLELQEKAFLQQPSQKQLVGNLFQVVTSTAIDKQSGSATEGSLRTMEVVIPVTLVGDIQVLNPIGNGEHQQAQRNVEDVVGYLEKLLSLVTHIGANKNRGFGRVSLTVNAQIQ